MKLQQNMCLLQIFLAGEFDVSSYYEGTVNSCTVDGKLYGVPFGANCLALVNRSDFL